MNPYPCHVTALISKLINLFSSKFYSHFLKKKKRMNEKNIHRLSCDIQNWAQLHPASADCAHDDSAAWLKHTCSKFSGLDLICKGTSMSLWSYDDGSLNIELQDSIETSNKFCRAAGTVASIICAWRKFGVGCPLGRKGLGHVGHQELHGSHSSVSSSLWGIRNRLFFF